ncbi:MAG: hypothetical protein Unbinned4098contig1000_33 [Prokaryotic dsDNA virus sp.]|nr:MAG: hypothetical protein Unbinned4098contig1000_33 [Prokaryotic dsDNA virus sp.]|tara:strand:- start:12952 stop:14019 length:1068 start_codon:yes stop_codon:yes gene_type:complete
MAKIGIGFSIGYAEESAWGTAASSASHFLDPRGGMESLQGEVDHITPESLSYRGSDSAQFITGMKRVSGNITHDLRFGGGWLMFLSHLTGHKYAKSGSGSPYTHTVQLGRDLSAGTTDPQDRGISILVNREGENAASGAKAWRYEGMRPVSCDMTFEQGSIATASWEFIGKDVTAVSIPTATLPTNDYIAHPSAGSGTLTKSVKYGTDGSETGYDVRSMTIHIEQAHAERRTLEDATQLKPVAGGNFIVNGSFEIEAPDMGTSGTFDAFTDAYRASTMKSLIMTVEGAELTSGNNAKLSFDFPKVRITNVGEPQVSDAGLVLRTVEWEASYSGTASTGVGTATLITSDAEGYTAA